MVPAPGAIAPVEPAMPPTLLAAESVPRVLVGVVVVPVVEELPHELSREAPAKSRAGARYQVAFRIIKKKWFEAAIRMVTSAQQRGKYVFYFFCPVWQQAIPARWPAPGPPDLTADSGEKLSQ